MKHAAAEQRGMPAHELAWRGKRSWFWCCTLAAVLSAMPSHVSGEEVEDVEETEISALDREHWAFLPLKRPPLPARKKETAWPHPIDQFVATKLRAETALPLASPTPPSRWLRRVTFDLTGLPPTPNELSSFLGNTHPEARQQVIDRLLASPEHGARWGQFWLDLARFAETDGFEHDKVRPQAYQYRDWVVRALNADMPYDQFVRWQIAGDLLQPNNQGATTATAFCLSGPDMPDINLQQERRHVLLNEITSTVGAVLLGLQVGCAQCHDHMYDPVSQADFYRLRAFFESAVQVKRNESIGVLTQPAIESHAKGQIMVRGDFRRPGPAVLAAIPRVLAEPGEEVTQRAEFAHWLTDGGRDLVARVIVNRVWQFHFGRALAASPSDVGVMGAEPTHPLLLDWLAVELVDSGWSLKHVHRLIVSSQTYAQRSTAPAEPTAWSARIEADAENRWYGRFPRKRLEAEAIRDAMYAVGGVLNDQAGGPGVRPPLPPELTQTLLKNQWTPTPNEAAHYRRSVYLFARRNLRFPLLAMFDRPSANVSCARRQSSTTAPQSLMMLNSADTLRAAQWFAGSLLSQSAEEDEWVRAAVTRALGRTAGPAEVKTLLAFLKQQRERIEVEERTQLALPMPYPSSIDRAQAAALTDLCLALLNCNEFLFVD